MTIDETIERLKELREIAGGETQVCVEVESVESGRINIYEPAVCELYSSVGVGGVGKVRNHFVTLCDGNTDQIVVFWA